MDDEAIVLQRNLPIHTHTMYNTDKIISFSTCSTYIISNFKFYLPNFMNYQCHTLSVGDDLTLKEGVSDRLG